MVKFLRIKNRILIEILIYKMYPAHHELLELKDLNDWMIDRINSGFMESSEFSKCNFDEKLSFKGMVKFPDHYETPNGILVDIETKKYIKLHINNFYKYCVYLEEIFPQINKLCEFEPETQIDGLYSYIDIRKKFPNFSDEEWNDFIEKGLESGGFEWTIDV